MHKAYFLDGRVIKKYLHCLEVVLNNVSLQIYSGKCVHVCVCVNVQTCLSFVKAVDKVSPSEHRISLNFCKNSICSALLFIYFTIRTLMGFLTVKDDC